MTERVYTINELKTLISESANEFKAKIGDGVNTSNDKENKNAYSMTKSKIKNFDGGGDEIVEKRELPEKEDGNKTTLDYTSDNVIDKKYKDKIKAQSEGYTSTLEKNNNIEKTGDFSDKTYKQFKKAGEEIAKNIEDIKKRGLTASKAPENTFKKNGMYENKKISVLNFKNTTFINESQMVSRIPDDYKFEGNRFKVKDAGFNEFVVEWVDGEASILSYENKKKLNESISKFHKLTGYKSKDHFKTSTTQTRLNESNEFNKILNKARIITDKSIK